MNQIIEILKSIVEPVSVLFLLVMLLLMNAWIFKRIKSTPADGNTTRNTISVFLILIGILVFILSLPIDNSLKGQILTFLGIIISAGIALSSTTLLGNIIAGIMNNSMKRFRNGDLIKIGDLQGRVIKISIFHTEIQLEDSNFITIPNLYIASNPVKLTRKTNTVISTTVSLGYDVPRNKIENTLKEAANATGLRDPYVYITHLGDFSIVYKIHGFLEDSSKFFSTSSMLNGNVIDKLHENGIEIVSPAFMNQRKADDKVFIPEQVSTESKPETSASPEALIFDEAIKSEKIEKKKDYLKVIEEKLDTLEADLKASNDTNEQQSIKAMIEKNEDLKKRILESIESQSEDNNNTK